MASSSSMHFLFISLLIALLSVTVSAGRPCKALFITSYSVSIKPISSINHQSSGFVAVAVTETTPTEVILTRRPLFPQLHRVPQDVRRTDRQESSFPSLPIASSAGSNDFSSSLQERINDILRVAVGLSLVVAFLVFTAASMYVMIWSVCTWRSASNQESDQDDDDIAKLKKLGYVKIPAVKS